MKLHIHCTQWRIQDFPKDYQPWGGIPIYYLVILLPKTARKRKKLSPPSRPTWHKLSAAQPTSGSLDLKWSVHICGRLGILRLTTSQFVFTQYIHHVRRPCMKFYFLFSQTRLAGVFYRSYLVKAVASPSTVRRTHAHRPVCVRTKMLLQMCEGCWPNLFGVLQQIHTQKYI